MANRRKTSPAEDVLDLVSMLPWWGGVALAVISYVLLHAVAAQPVPAAPVQPSQLGQYVAGTVWRTLAYYGQFLLPLLCLGGAAVSAWRRKQREELLDRVAQSKAANALDGISWQEFEMLVGEVFRTQGYQVMENGGNSPDGGVDLILRKGEELFLVQCKYWKAFRVGVDVARELYGVMAAKGAAGGFVVTSGRFTDAATKFAQGRNLSLIDGTLFMKLARQANVLGNPAENPQGLAQRGIAAAAEHASPACPLCARQMVRRIAKRGAQAGNAFWGCAAYPSCKGTRPLG